jgi:hypothetical protein
VRKTISINSLLNLPNGSMQLEPSGTRSITVIQKLVAMLCLTLWNWSCASTSPILPPSFDLRTYRISESLDGFEYQWREDGRCVKKLLWKCLEWEEVVKTEKIKFEDKEGIKKFRDANFVLKGRKKL